MLAAERVRYERNLTQPLSDSGDYRAGVADAMDLDAPSVVAEILHT